MRWGWLCLFLVACGGGESAKPVLHVFTWADYVEPGLVKQFEAAHDCRVVIDTFDSNEAMYAKLKAGASGYDVVFPSSYYVSVMMPREMLQPLQHGLLPNLVHVDRDYVTQLPDPDMRVSVPYTTSYTGIGYLSQLGDLEPTWQHFYNQAWRGRMTLLGDMRETIGSALKANGFSLNSTDDAELAIARDTVIAWKANIAKFENEQYKFGLASGEFQLVHGYSGDILQARRDNPEIHFLFPKEGFPLTCDQMVIPTEADNPTLAHHFINFLLDPQVSAKNAAYIGFACPNTGAYPLLPENLRNDPVFLPPLEVRQRGEFLRDLGEANAKYADIWNQIRSAD